MKLKTLIYISAILMVLFLGTVGLVVARIVWKQTRDRNARLYLLLGYKYTRETEWEDAVRSYTKSIRLSPTNAMAYYYRGDGYFRLKEFDEAIQDFNQVVQLQPTNSVAIEYRGLAYGNKTNYSMAIADFTEAIKLRSHVGLNYFRRGYTYSRERRWKDAIADYQKAIQLVSTNATYYHSLAYAYVHMRDPTNAMKNFNRALLLEPDNPKYLNSLSWFFAAYPDATFRDGLAAVGLADKACKFTDWRRGSYVDTLAAAYAETGDFTNAVKYEKQALRMDGASEKEDLEERHRLELYEQHQPYHEPLKDGKSDNALK